VAANCADTGDISTISCAVDASAQSSLTAGYRATCRTNNEIVAECSDLGRWCQRALTTPEPLSLRWVLVHMVEETARHAGHADIIREQIDGMTGR
jgi:hypothetical protein